MTISNMILYMISNLLRTYVNDCFLVCFLEGKQTEVRKRILAGFIFFCLTSAGYLIFQMPVVNILTNIMGILIMALVYEGNWKKQVILAFMVYGVNMACDVIVMLSFSDYGYETQIVSTYEGCVTVLLLAICQIFVCRFMNTKKNATFVAPHWKILLLIPITGIGMIHQMVTTSLFDRQTVVIQSIGLLTINIIVFYLNDSMENVCLQNAENEIFKKQAKAYANELDIILQTQDQIRSLQHDMKHHFRELMAMAQAEQSKEILTYLEHLKQFMQNPEEFVYSGNKEIDGNLNHMVKKAHTVLKDVMVKVRIPEGVTLNIHPFDLNVVLGNLMENAIEAAYKTDEQYLSLDLRQHKNLLLLTIKNSYCGPLREKEGIFFSQKADITNHGYGLKNVKRIVEKYNGVMEISHTDSIFCVDIMLYIPDSEADEE